MSQTATQADTLDAETAAIVAAAKRAMAKLEAGAAINSVELSALTGIDERTVQRQAREGRYPCQRPTGDGSALRFSPGDVAEIRKAIARPARTAA